MNVRVFPKEAYCAHLYKKLNLINIKNLYISSHSNVGQCQITNVIPNKSNANVKAQLCG